jgi:DNA-binding transcriptional regulator YiaG
MTLQPEDYIVELIKTKATDLEAKIGAVLQAYLIRCGFGPSTHQVERQRIAEAVINSLPDSKEAANRQPDKGSLAQIMTPAQCHIARKRLGLSRHDLAKSLGLPSFKILAFETAGVMLSEAERRSLRRVLESAGVVFGEENGGGAGMRLKSPSTSKPHDHARRAQGVFDARQMADQAIDRHFERSTDVEFPDGRHDHPLVVVLSKGELEALDEWIAAQPDPKPRREDAARRLILEGAILR